MIYRFLFMSIMSLLVISLSAYTSPIFKLISDEKVITTSGKLLRTDEIFSNDLHDGKLQIRYLHLETDKKSGDSILIKSPDGKTMLIDAGIVDTGKILNNYLDQLSVDQIDYAIATHPHHDHIGGYHTILESREVGLLLMPDLAHTTDVYSTFLKIIQEKNIEPTYVKEGDSFLLGEDVKVEVLSPSKGSLEKAEKEKKLSTRDINNLSLVLKVTYGENTFLFTSDVYKKQEGELIHLKMDSLNVDLLDAPHHGKNTSSSQRFIQTVNPAYTLISANLFQSEKVYERYRKSGSEVYATSLDGNILIVSDGDNINILTEKDRVEKQ